jgi:CTLH/CRA C-terminal to LisH motif domain
VSAQILEQRHVLAFHLQQQRLIELIRNDEIDKALDFAQEFLAPQGEEDPMLLEELGKSESLFVPSRICLVANVTSYKCVNKRWDYVWDRENHHIVGL